MAHRFTNLQNEFGKPVIAAGTKKPTGEKDLIDLTWLDTTDKEGKKVVVDTTLDEVKNELEGKVGALDTKLGAAQSDLMETVVLLANNVEKDANKHADDAVSAAKEELQGTLMAVANDVENKANEAVEAAKKELKEEITDSVNDLQTGLLAVDNENLALIQKNEEAIAEAKRTVYSTEAKVEDILNRGFTFSHEGVVLEGPTYKLKEGEQFISALGESSKGLTNFLPTIERDDEGNTILRFFEDDDEVDDMKVTIILATPFNPTKEGEEEEEG